MEDGCEFRGIEKTACSILGKEKSKEMKLRQLAKTISQVYRLSEDYDSDSDSDNDEDRWLADAKKVKKRLKKIDSSKLEVSGKLVKLISSK